MSGSRWRTAAATGLVLYLAECSSKAAENSGDAGGPATTPTAPVASAVTAAERLRRVW